MTITDTSPDEAQTPNDLAELDELDDESWLESSQPKGVRVRLPLAAMTLGLALALGLWGGAKLEAGNAPAAVALAANAPGAGRGGGGLGGGGNAAAGGLSGTVSSVQGNTIKLMTSAGSTVTITLLPSTTISRTAAAGPSDITEGETITVRGQTAADGTTTAQTLAIIPAANAGG